MEDNKPWYFHHKIHTVKDVALFLSDYLEAREVDNAWIRIDDLDEWCPISQSEKSLIQKTLHNRLRYKRGINGQVFVYKQVGSYPLQNKRYFPQEYWIGTTSNMPKIYETVRVSRMRDYIREQERKAKIL